MTVVTAAVFGIFFFQVQKAQEPISLPGRGEGDSVFPVSQIVQPHEGVVIGRDFFVAVRDVDAGGSGIAKDECRYSVYDCGILPCVQTVSDMQRVCSDSFLVSAGEGKACPTQGRNACRVVVKSQDLAGNKNMQSEAQGSIRTFGVDLVSPKMAMGQPSLERASLRVSLEARVTDNVEVSNCDVAFGTESQYGLVPLQFSKSPCVSDDEGACYQVSGSYIFPVPGIYDLSLVCWDLAGNTGKSAIYNIEAIQNRSPQISFCRVAPALGTAATVFLFQVEAFDPDGDAMAYKWEFGDGTMVLGKDVSHQYKIPGTYTPLVRVKDDYGVEEYCSTTWMVVEVGEVQK